MRISSFLGDQVPSLYLVPSTLDLLRRCFDLPDGLVGPFVAFAELVRGGMEDGGSKFMLEAISEDLESLT